MILKIFLDDKSFHCLKQSIPSGSRSKSIIEKAVHLERFGSNAVLSWRKPKRGICCSMPAIARA